MEVNQKKDQEGKMVQVLCLVLQEVMGVNQELKVKEDVEDYLITEQVVLCQEQLV